MGRRIVGTLTFRTEAAALSDHRLAMVRQSINHGGSVGTIVFGDSPRLRVLSMGAGMRGLKPTLRFLYSTAELPGLKPRLRLREERVERRTNSETGSLLAASFAVLDFRPVAENGGGGN